MVLFKTLWHIIENLKNKSKRNERSFIENGKKEIRCYKQKGARKPFVVLQRFWSKLNEFNETSWWERKGFAVERSAEFIGSELL